MDILMCTARTESIQSGETTCLHKVASTVDKRGNPLQCCHPVDSAAAAVRQQFSRNSVQTFVRPKAFRLGPAPSAHKPRQQHSFSDGLASLGRSMLASNAGFHTGLLRPTDAEPCIARTDPHVLHLQHCPKHAYSLYSMLSCAFRCCEVRTDACVHANSTETTLNSARHLHLRREPSSWQ